MTKADHDVQVKRIQVGMSNDAHMVEGLRQNRKTLYVVTALYVVVGFVLATASAIQGDRLGTFLGFVIISGAMAFALVLRSLLVIGTRVCLISSDLARIQERFDRIESRLVELTREATLNESEARAARSKLMDLSSMGRGDPSLLTATTLDRAAYPRLVRTMEQSPPSVGAVVDHGGASLSHGTLRVEEDTEAGARSGVAAATPNQDVHEPVLKLHRDEKNGSESVATKNLLRTWKSALRDGDLLTCRDVFSTMVDTADAVDIEPLRRQLESLADRTERPLREAFSRCIHAKDYSGAIAVGEQIRRLLGDRPIAKEFERLRPLLDRKWEQARGARNEGIA